MMNIPGLGNQGGEHQTNNNTEAGETESSEEQAFRIMAINKQHNQNTTHKINMPGLNPMKKNKF